MLLLLLAGALVANLSLGSVHIPLRDILGTLTGSDASRESWGYIIWNYRLPKALTAVMVGSGLSLCGLLMQTRLPQVFCKGQFDPQTRECRIEEAPERAGQAKPSLGHVVRVFLACFALWAVVE